jgi:hypothetical protein
MPFLLYSCSNEDDGSLTFRIIRRVGEIPKIIGEHVHTQYLVEQKTPLSWHMPDSNFIYKLSGSSGKYALIIDLKPKMSNNVSLFQVKDFWGYSYESWTPVAVRLETLFVDENKKNPDEFKKHFNDRNCPRERVHEFLYLQAGTKEGKWNWGKIGFVNGALLWPDALTFFINEII